MPANNQDINSPVLRRVGIWAFCSAAALVAAGVVGYLLEPNEWAALVWGSMCGLAGGVAAVLWCQRG